MKYDYYAECNCGVEFFSSLLKEIKKKSEKHLVGHPLAGKIQIKRYFPHDIDESFKEIIITN